jgi:hypothetical protein
MAAPSLNTELNKYFSMLTPIQKESVLSLIKSFVSPDDVTTRISIEQYNQELKEAESEYKKGEFISHEEFVKSTKKW